MMLEVDGVSQTYREAGRRLLAIHDVSFTVADGEFVSIIGPSGCGKSTLLQVIAGLQQPDGGAIKIGGQEMHSRLGVTAYMPQQDALLPWRSVLGNVVLGPEVRGGWRKQARQRALDLIPMFGLEGFEDAFPAQLSGGMRQRAALLRTFLVGQDILLLDEPFGALDALTRRDLQSWLLDVWQHFGYTILFVTHDVEEAIILSDRVVVLSRSPGRIVGEYTIPLARPRERCPEFDELEDRLFKALQS